MKTKNICTDQKWSAFTKWPTFETCHHCGPKNASTIPVATTRSALRSRRRQRRRPTNRRSTAVDRAAGGRGGYGARGSAGAPGSSCRDRPPVPALKVTHRVAPSTPFSSVPMRERHDERHDEQDDHPDDHQEVRDRDEDKSPAQIRRWRIHAEHLPLSAAGADVLVPPSAPRQSARRRLAQLTTRRGGGHVSLVSYLCRDGRT